MSLILKLRHLPNTTKNTDMNTSDTDMGAARAGKESKTEPADKPAGPAPSREVMSEIWRELKERESVKKEQDKQNEGKTLKQERTFRRQTKDGRGTIHQEIGGNPEAIHTGCHRRRPREARAGKNDDNRCDD